MQMNNYPVSYKDLVVGDYIVKDIRYNYGVLMLDIARIGKKIYDVEIRHCDESDEDYYSCLVYRKKHLVYSRGMIKKESLFVNFTAFIENLLNIIPREVNEMIEVNKKSNQILSELLDSI